VCNIFFLLSVPLSSGSHIPEQDDSITRDGNRFVMLLCYDAFRWESCWANVFKNCLIDNLVDSTALIVWHGNLNYIRESFK
jgi:hypothetical protein